MNNHGETLVEVMASILISALAIALLFNTVAVVNKMDAVTDVVDANFNTCLTAAESGVRAVDEGGNEIGEITGDTTVLVCNAYDDILSTNIDVEWHGGAGAWSYSMVTSEEIP